MSDRDELAEILERSDPEGGSHPDYGGPEFSYWYPQADAVIAAGWRKKPSREAVEFALYERLGGNVDLGEPFMPDHYNRMKAENLADAILALLDGPTETEGN